MIVDDRAGAAGNIGAEEAIKTAPDGYTLFFSYPAPLVVNKTLYTKLSYDPDSFVPISLVAIVPLVLAVYPKLALAQAADARSGQGGLRSMWQGRAIPLVGPQIQSAPRLRVHHLVPPAMTNVVLHCLFMQQNQRV